MSASVLFSYDLYDYNSFIDICNNLPGRQLSVYQDLRLSLEKALMVLPITFLKKLSLRIDVVVVLSTAFYMNNSL